MGLYLATCCEGSVTLKSGSLSLADGTFAAGLGPDGTSWNVASLGTSLLRSITISARKSNTTDANFGSGFNQVGIITTYNKTVLLTGESVTFSAEDGNIQDFIEVVCMKNSAALVIYNTI
jgi:hypothetical protein